MTDDRSQNSPFPGLTFAGPMDDLIDLSMELAMTDDWNAYMNQLVLYRWSQIHPGRLTHLKFLPDTEAGEVIMVPAASGQEYGAQEVRYTETENGAWVNLRLALKRLKIQKLEGRVRIFNVAERTAPNGQVYLAFIVKDSRSRPVRKAKTQESQSQATAAALQYDAESEE